VQILSIAAALGGMSELQAQEPADTARLEPVVVTATRVPTPRASVTATVTVLDGAALRAQGIRMIGDALREVPGLDVVQSGSYGGLTSVFVRGGESDYVKVLIDGAPVNDPGGAFDFSTLSVENVERIEIVRGPVSVMYGSDAVAGVVQIFTRRGAGRLEGEAAARGGTYGSFDWNASAQGGTDRVRYSAAVARAATDGIYEFNSDYAHLVFSGLLRLTPDARTDAQLAVRYADNDYHYPTDGSGQVVDRNSFQQQDRLTASLDAGRYFSDAVQGRLLLAFNRTDGGINDLPDGPADTLSFFGFVSERVVTRSSVGALANFYAIPMTVLTVGADFEHESEQGTSESLSEFGSSISEFDAARNNLGYYGEVQANPAKGLTATLGGRIDDNQQFGTFFTYRGGITYGLATGTHLRAAIGTAFKEPTFFENFSDDPFATGNPDLDPERTNSWELGVEQRFWDDRVAFGVTYFDQRFQDLIQYTFAPPEPDAPNFYNVAAADASGVETTVTVRPRAGVTLRGSYTYLRTEVVDAGFDEGGGLAPGDQLPRRPAHRLTADLAWRFVERAYAGLRVLYVGEREDLDFSTFPIPHRYGRAAELLEARRRGRGRCAEVAGAATQPCAHVADREPARREHSGGVRIPGAGKESTSGWAHAVLAARRTLILEPCPSSPRRPWCSTRSPTGRRPRLRGCSRCITGCRA
jgi:vitamin B12 transporter